MFTFAPSLPLSLSKFSPSPPFSPRIPANPLLLRTSNRPLSASLLSTSPIDALPAPTKSLIRSSVPLLSAHSVEIGTLFYETMFSNHPAFRQQFTLDRQAGGSIKENGAPAQVVAVTRALINFGKNVDDISKLSRSMEGIFHKHVSRGVYAEQYPAVGECFLKAAKEVLGDEMNEEVCEAWKIGFGALAEVYVENETTLRMELEKKAGYEGFKEFEIGDVEEKEKARVFWLINGKGPGEREVEGMYVGMKIRGVEGMVSGKIVKTSDLGMRVEVREGKARGGTGMREGVKKGEKVVVSVPCGKTGK